MLGVVDASYTSFPCRSIDTESLVNRNVVRRVTTKLFEPRATPHIPLLKCYAGYCKSMRVVKVDGVDRFIIKSGNLIVAARDGKSSLTSDEHIGKTY